MSPGSEGSRWMSNRLRAPYLLSWAVVALMVVQATLGLIFSDQYRDVAWIRSTWFGNDWVTLVLAVPLLGFALMQARKGSVMGLLLWLGMLGYAAYNYAYYMLGAALNVFFPLYIATLVLSVVALILVLARIQPTEIAGAFRSTTPVRIIGGYLVFTAVGLASVWLLTWAGYVFAGKPTPIEPEAFKLVAALDLSLMVTAMGFGGVLLWRRNAWGYAVASIAAIQGALYLLVLTVNSLISVARGLTDAPGEIPLWGTLAVLTTAAALALLGGLHRGATFAAE